ncbi:MAG: hypothetical protein GY801_51765 [bacterium]|nr:hypothetical protein [bacterium]
MTAMILRKLDPYIPAEDSVFALLIKQMIVLFRCCKVAAVIGGIIVIYTVAQMFVKADIRLPPGSTKIFKSVVSAFSPLFLELLSRSLEYLWLPIVLYLLLTLLTKAVLWRKFWCLVGFSWFFLLFVGQVQTTSWKEYHLLPLLMLQSYLFLLWLLPQEIWNIIGLTISLILGLIVLILPDLPTAFDDFGLFGAILVFFLGYLNLLASLIQRAAQRL